MTNVAHTPGPWHPMRINHAPGFYDWVISCQKGNVALLRERDEDEANARLIAAAPDLLEACKRAREEVDLSYETQDMLTAAIAKAEGSSSPS